MFTLLVLVVIEALTVSVAAGVRNGSYTSDSDAGAS
jgi:hypothetical protein